MCPRNASMPLHINLGFFQSRAPNFWMHESSPLSSSFLKHPLLVDRLVEWGQCGTCVRAYVCVPPSVPLCISLLPSGTKSLSSSCSLPVILHLLLDKFVVKIPRLLPLIGFDASHKMWTLPAQIIHQGSDGDFELSSRSRWSSPGCAPRIAWNTRNRQREMEHSHLEHGPHKKAFTWKGV